MKPIYPKCTSGLKVLLRGTQRALQWHLRLSTYCILKSLEHFRHLRIQRVLGHSSTQGTWIHGDSRTWNSGTQRKLGHSGSQALGYLWHLGTCGTWVLVALYLEDSGKSYNVMVSFFFFLNVILSGISPSIYAHHYAQKYSFQASN